MKSRRRAALSLAGVLLVMLAGCETTHQRMLAEGYPPAYADGFNDGCDSGVQAAGSIQGQFRKDVPRFLGEAQYSSGWTDGFRQCQAMRQARDSDSRITGFTQEHDRRWEQQKTQGAGKAYRSH